MRDNSLVVGWPIFGHPVFGGLYFRAIPGGVCAVFAMKEAVEPSWLWSLAFVSSSGVGAMALLCGILLTMNYVSGAGGLAMALTCCWLRFGLPDSDFTGLTHVLLDYGVSLGFR
jgi:hypothetical protein